MLPCGAGLHSTDHTGAQCLSTLPLGGTNTHTYIHIYIHTGRYSSFMLLLHGVVLFSFFSHTRTHTHTHTPHLVSSSRCGGAGDASWYTLRLPSNSATQHNSGADGHQLTAVAGPGSASLRGELAISIS